MINVKVMELELELDLDLELGFSSLCSFLVYTPLRLRKLRLSGKMLPGFPTFPTKEEGLPTWNKEGSH